MLQDRRGIGKDRKEGGGRRKRRGGGGGKDRQTMKERTKPRNTGKMIKNRVRKQRHAHLAKNIAKRGNIDWSSHL